MEINETGMKHNETKQTNSIYVMFESFPTQCEQFRQFIFSQTCTCNFSFQIANWRCNGNILERDSMNGKFFGWIFNWRKRRCNFGYEPMKICHSMQWIIFKMNLISELVGQYVNKSLDEALVVMGCLDHFTFECEIISLSKHNNRSHMWLQRNSMNYGPW